ncbi:hypothetical protein [Spirosoma montaniterrae]|uniref:Uncharacterized protein n=1 Tax=Spirosoma montaniterrae TaxID=1178516 RepID=A0A1P9X1B3_9BACT|nr:hypothetical protein [Spirosoma montaniterrae]AQG81419.1 hypothetical protein AWR27_20115 [Spirosoma montaniterrae]
MDSFSKPIPGIYNYCDAWCARCLFTNRCRSFQIQQEAGLVKAATNSPDLVQQLTDALTLTKQYVEKLNQTNRLIGPDTPTEPQTLALEEKALLPVVDIRRHPLAKLANVYLKQSGRWLSAEKDLLTNAGQEQRWRVELGLQTEEDAMPVLRALKDAWDVIGWYRTLIPVKLLSALRFLTEPATDEHLNDYHLGKAKLVLVSIDRSLMAWETLLTHFPDKTDDVLDLLALLCHLRRDIETLFPNARAFRRPGLD